MNQTLSPCPCFLGEDREAHKLAQSKAESSGFLCLFCTLYSSVASQMGVNTSKGVAEHLLGMGVKTPRCSGGGGKRDSRGQVGESSALGGRG